MNNNYYKISRKLQEKLDEFLKQTPVKPTNIEQCNNRVRIVFSHDGAELIYVISEASVVARFWKPDGSTVEDAIWLDSFDVENVGKDIRRFCENPKNWLWRK